MAKPTILVTTDLSPLGDAALPTALALARGLGARLLLASVVETPPAPSPLYAHYYPMPKPEEIERSRAKVLDELRSRLAGGATAGVEAECHVSDGNPAGEIVRLALDRGVSMIVMSTHGRTGVKRFLLGSVADRVLRETTCPVLLVR
jgi:nucleotide-binding universal stress UspA family protein